MSGVYGEVIVILIIKLLQAVAQASASSTFLAFLKQNQKPYTFLSRRSLQQDLAHHPEEQAPGQPTPFCL